MGKREVGKLNREIRKSESRANGNSKIKKAGSDNHKNGKMGMVNDPNREMKNGKLENEKLEEIL